MHNALIHRHWHRNSTVYQLRDPRIKDYKFILRHYNLSNLH